MYEIVEFASQGATLRGRLYLPQRAVGPLPIVIMAHGYSTTIDGMVADRYAEVFYEAGLAVLLYDHYGFGISGGAPRYEVNRWTQAQGYRDAITYVSGLEMIDNGRVAIWGDSLSAGVVMVMGAVDGRVKAVVAQVPAAGREPAPADPDGSMYESMKETIMHGNLTVLPKTVRGPLPVVSSDQLGNPSLLKPITAFRWFMHYGAVFGTNWENQATYAVPETPAPWHVGFAGPYIKAPLLMVVGYEDEMPGANADVARQIYETVPGDKKLVEVEGGHFGIVYYPSELFDIASKTQRDFLLERFC